MKVKLVEETRREDVFHPPGKDQPERERYSEWHHFNLSDPDNGVYAIYNLALSGDVHDPLEARAGASLVVYRRGGGWHGTMNLYTMDEVRYGAGEIDLRIGGNSVQYEDGVYRVAGALRDGSVALRAELRPSSAPVHIDNIGGVVSSFIMPRLEARGELDLEGVTLPFERATMYHDHNWGYWDWGQDLGWDWGFLHQGPDNARASAAHPAEPLTVVFGKVTDARRGADRSDLVLLSWSGAGFSQVFLDRAVSIEYFGELDPSEVRRVPGVLDLLESQRPWGIPRRTVLRVENGTELLEIRFDVESALQFLIPHPRWRQRSVITELVGEYHAKGRLDGRDVSFSFFGFAEIAG